MFTAILLGCSVYAQENADLNTNKFLLGGNIAFDFANKNITTDSYNYNDKIDTFNSGFFHFRIYSGFNISPKVALGLKLGFSYYENTYAHLGKYTHSSGYANREYGITDGTSFEIAPFVRIQNNLVGKLKYYFDFSLGTAFSGKMKAMTAHLIGVKHTYFTDYKFNYYYAAVDCGLIYLFSKKAGVEFKIARFEIGKKLEKLDGDIQLEIESIDSNFLPHLIQPNLGFVINF
jgi:hypothetical protein